MKENTYFEVVGKRTVISLSVTDVIDCTLWFVAQMLLLVLLLLLFSAQSEGEMCLDYVIIKKKVQYRCGTYCK